jgi:hypothetical protein
MKEDRWGGDIGGGRWVTVRWSGRSSGVSSPKAFMPSPRSAAADVDLLQNMYRGRGVRLAEESIVGVSDRLGEPRIWPR